MPSLPPQPIGVSEPFLAILDRVSNTAALEKPVLVVGERGTGKELIASRLHFLSPRWEQVYVSVNCAAFTDTELDEELFGQTFLDGREDTNGRFYEADGGTLFLDNVDVIPPRLQEKMMRAVEYGQYEAHGEAATQEVDVRVIAATGVDLPAAVARGQFRADLLDRLAFDVITLPPLRVRPDDILPLSEFFGRKIAVDLGAESFPGFSSEAIEALRGRTWPGNVRELKSVIERSTARAWLDDETLSEPISTLIFDPFAGPYRLRDRVIPPQARPQAPVQTVTSPYALDAPTATSETAHAAAPPASGQAIDTPMAAYTLPPIAAQAQTSVPDVPSAKGLKDRVFRFERQLLDEALRAANGHQGQAAERLELSYHSFRGLLRKHGLKK